MANTDIKVRITGDSSGISTELDKVRAKVDDTLGSGGSLARAAKMGAAAMAGAFAVDKIVSCVGAVKNLSDEYTNTIARLNLINDGQQTTVQLMRDIHDAANASRGSYQEMAVQVGKLGTLASSAFSSNKEMITFVQQLNEQFKIGGASLEEQHAAMLQITQAMASGRLQGDEFRSVLENAPMLAQAIAQEMGVSLGKLRDLSSQGVITSDIIKNALLNTADETNAKFAEMPMTFGEVWQQIQNDALLAFQPILDTVGSITRSQEFQDGLAAIGQGLMALQPIAQLTISSISGVFGALVSVIRVVVSAVQSVLSVFRAMASACQPATIAIAGLTAGFVAWKLVNQQAIAAWLAQKTAIIASTAVMVAQKIAMAGLVTTMLIVRAAVLGWNAAIVISRALMAGVTAMTIAYKAGQIAAASATYVMSAAQAVLNAVLTANPIGIVIVALAALAAAFGTAGVASNGFRATVASVFESIVNTVAWGVNKAIGLINSLIDALNAVGAKVASVFKGTFTPIQHLGTISDEQVQGFISATENAAGAFVDSFSSAGAGNVPEDGYGGGGGGYSAPAGSSGGAGGAGGAGGDASNGLADKAKEITKEIEDAYDELFKSKSEQVDKWFKEEKDKLDESKAYNESYNQDLEKLNAVYADKRERALYEEAKRTREIQNSIRDMAQDMSANIDFKNLDGAAKVIQDVVSDHQKAIASIKDKWQKYADDYADMTAQERETFKKSLDERQIAYETMGNNIISFNKAMNAEIIAQQEATEKQLQDIKRQGKDIQAEIDIAVQEQNLTRLQNALSDENIAYMEAYEQRKAMFDEYQQAVYDAHVSMSEFTLSVEQQGFDKLSEGLSGLIQGTKTLGDAWKGVMQAVNKAIGDYIASWIAGMLKKSLFGRALEKQEAAASIATASAQIPVYSELALLKSMATSGASATAGTAAFTAGLGASQLSGLAAPGLKLASGGLAYGETVATIGEGRYKEAVLPLSENVFNQLGEGINKSENGGGRSVTVNVSAVDAQSFSGWLRSSGGSVLRQYLSDSNRDFTAETGVW